MNAARERAVAHWDDLGGRLARAVETLLDLATDGPGGVVETHRRRQKAAALDDIHGRWQRIGFRDDASSFDLLRQEVDAIRETGTPAVREACATALDYLRSY